MFINEAVLMALPRVRQRLQVAPGWTQLGINNVSIVERQRLTLPDPMGVSFLQ
jgi:hypothetical protein